MDHRRIGSGKAHLCLHFFSSSHRSAEQNFQHIVGAVGFSGKRKGILYLGNDLVLCQDLGLQSAGEIKEMFHCFLFLSLYKILLELLWIPALFPA